MARRWIYVFLFMSASFVLAQARKEPVLKSYDPLVYPPIARVARVSGEVTVEFSVDARGETTSVSAVGGPAMLRGGAENFVKSWKFDFAGTALTPEDKFRTTIRYKAVEGIADPRTDPGLTVKSDSFHHFEAEILVGNIMLSSCPTGADEDVPSHISTGDSVEVERYSCMGTCPDYSVRVQADGKVSWDGRSSVEMKGKMESSVDPDVARKLLEKFRNREFWAYCGDYTDNGEDGSSTSITVKMSGRTRTISDHDETSPAASQELMLEVDRAADSHRYRHGDPTKEPITRIDSDAYLPKPGVTPLMIAATNDKVDKLKALIDAGADVKEVDASGWTALMYASSPSSDFPVQILLKAGADPNQSSPHGDTPLMVSALSGYWNEGLVKAGARMNAQNKDGQTALMILSSRGEPDEIRKALNAGANASLRDARGRTALDYLVLASCGKSPLYDPISDWNHGYIRCTAINADDLRKSKELLRNASRARH